MALDRVVQQAEIGWSSVQKILYVPHSNAEYERLVEVLDQLIDQVGEDESHPLASLMEVIGVLIERYEDEIAQLHGVGPKAIRILREALSELGLSFASRKGSKKGE